MNDNIPARRGQSGAYSFTRKTLLITAAVVVLLLVALWVWKIVAVNRAEKAAEQRELQLKQQAAAHLLDNHVRFLRILAKPYVWAVRDQMMEGNIGQLNLYNNDIVKEKYFAGVMISDAEGMIVSATNKKFEGKPMSAVDPGLSLTADSTMVKRAGDSTLTLVSPVMGFNSRLGTLIVSYNHQAPGFLE